MTRSEFIAVVDSAAPGPLGLTGISQLLTALALDRRGNWDAAHSIAQEDPTARGSAVHAYLHRKEGVHWNAEYWYRRAGRLPFTGPLDDEWRALADELLVD